MAKKKTTKAASTSTADMQAAFGVQEVDFGYLPMRCYAANILLGGQGLNRGRMVEIFGQEGSGKTTLCYELMAIAAAMGFVVVFFDQEKSADDLRLAKFGLYEGVNLIKCREHTIEDVFIRLEEIVTTLKDAKDARPVVACVDSVGIMVPREYFENAKAGERPRPGSVSQAWSANLKMWFAREGDIDCTILLINHMTEVIEMGWSPVPNQGKKFTTPGGRPMKHVVHSRLEVIRSSNIKGYDGDTIVGAHINLKVHKHRGAPPFQYVKLPLFFGDPTKPPGDPTDLVGTNDCLACRIHLKDKGAITSSGSKSKLILKLANGSEEPVEWTGDAGWYQVYQTRQMDVYRTMYHWHYKGHQSTLGHAIEMTEENGE